MANLPDDVRDRINENRKTPWPKSTYWKGKIGPNKGKNFSQKHRDKISKSVKRYWENK